MRSSWITLVGPKSDDRCPHKRYREVSKKRRKGNVTAVVEIGVAQPQVMPTATRSWKRQGTDSPLVPPGGMWPCQYLYFRLLASGTARE